MWHTTTHGVAEMDWLNDVIMSCRDCYWVIDVFLDVHSLFLRIAWWCGVFNDLRSWKMVAKLCSFCLPLVVSFVHSTTSESLGMLPIAFPYSSSRHVWTVYLFLWFTHDGTTSIRKLPNIRWCIVIHEIGPRLMTAWERRPSNYTLRSYRWEGAGLVTEIAQSVSRASLRNFWAQSLLGRKFGQLPLGVRIAQLREIVVDAGWDPRRWICAVFWGKEYWVEKSPGGQICAVLKVIELRLTGDTRGHLSAVLEAKGGWGIYALWSSNKKG